MHDELAELVAATRAYLEWHEDAGTIGLPAASRARAVELPRHEPPRHEPPRHEPPRHEPRPAPPSEARTTREERPEPRVPVTLERPGAPSGSPRPEPRRLSVVEATTPEARIARLAEMAVEVARCTRCPLHAERKQTVFARGNPDAELMFVGEGPGADEDEQGLPFVGKAGQLLDKMIQAMGYAPSDVYIANVVKCRPPMNRKPEPTELGACVGYIHEQIALVRPKMLVALGATAVEGLLEQTGIMRLRGTFRLYRGQIPVMPTFHPAYLLRTPEAKRDVWSDLQQVMAKLGKTRPR